MIIMIIIAKHVWTPGFCHFLSVHMEQSRGPCP